MIRRALLRAALALPFAPIRRLDPELAAVLAAFGPHCRATRRAEALNARAETLYRQYRRGAVEAGEYRRLDADLMAEQVAANREANDAEDALVDAVHALGPNARAAVVGDLLIVVAADWMASPDRDGFRPWSGRVLGFSLSAGEVAGAGHDDRLDAREPIRPAPFRGGGVHTPRQSRAVWAIKDFDLYESMPEAERRETIRLAVG